MLRGGSLPELTKPNDRRAPWELSAKYLKGVGPKLAALLEKADIESFWDILFHLPRAYEDRRNLSGYVELLKKADTNDPIVSQGVIESYIPKRSAGGRSWLEAEVLINPQLSGGVPHKIYFVWFHKFAEHFKRQNPVGTPIIFQGKIQSFRGRLQISHPNAQKTQQELPPWEFGSFIPV